MLAYKRLILFSVHTRIISQNLHIIVYTMNVVVTCRIITAPFYIIIIIIIIIILFSDASLPRRTRLVEKYNNIIYSYII